MDIDPQIKNQLEIAAQTVAKIKSEVGKILVGQKDLVDRLIVALITNGHILLEGVPGLAKTLAIKALARTVETPFSRIQFTPDLLPADLIGTRIFDPQKSAFFTHKGPIFSQFILADEINRAPAKVQSALLEAMEERQVTIEHETFKLHEPFMVLATQNPIETEGTYSLSEAQVDRFLFKVIVGYTNSEDEREIIVRMGLNEEKHSLSIVNKVLDGAGVLALRDLSRKVYVDEKVVEYILRLVDSTRRPWEYKLDLKSYIRFGASPRASIYLARAARSFALVKGRPYVKPDDIKSILPDIMRHRLIPTYEAEADEITSEEIIRRISEGVPVP
ncbi:MAG: MoxR family ATPase [Candidatus Riflebacteria bacterium]|nr:MoxR family ATPase [Candidatus Riflebacteria bacterium]